MRADSTTRSGAASRQFDVVVVKDRVDLEATAERTVEEERKVRSD